MPLLFDMFFKCGFDINKFKSTYEPYILDEHIKNYISDLPLNNQYKLCYEILFKYNLHISIQHQIISTYIKIASNHINISAYNIEIY